MNPFKKTMFVHAERRLTMSTEENKAIVRRITLEGFNLGIPAVLDEVVAADVFDHSPAPGMPPGREGYKQFIGILRAAFPDLEYTIDQQLAEGDMVATRVTGRGTHKGDFLGIAPTNRRVTWTQTHLSRMVDGKLVEHWADVDQLGMLQQLGAIPSSQPAA
jgi:predicted ester cyclase